MTDRTVETVFEVTVRTSGVPAGRPEGDVRAEQGRRLAAVLAVVMGGVVTVRSDGVIVHPEDG